MIRIIRFTGYFILLLVMFNSSAGLAQTFVVQTLQNIDFGLITTSGSAGFISIDENSIPTTSSNVLLLNQSTVSAASFLVSSTSLIPQNITVTAQEVYLVNSSNQTVLVRPIIPTNKSYTLSLLKPITVNVGAKLILNGNSPGTYNGDVDVLFILNTE